MIQAPLPDRLPSSSYRLQLRDGFAFFDAAAVVPYLKQLGVSECYLSPILAASPGSTHGYDLCDHNRINSELGGEEGFAQLTTVLQDHNFGLLLDFVPNHMGVDVNANLWWREVLENGPSSPFARFFDIDWKPVKEELRGKLLLPILADQYGVTLDSGQLQIEFKDGAIILRYFDLELPLNPRQLRILLRYNLEALEATLPGDDPDLNEFLSVLFHLDHLPVYTQSDSVSMAERQREKEVAKGRLAKLAETSVPIRRHIEDNIRRFNGTPGDSSSFRLLHELLEAQPYRLSSWRTAMHEINYRRFFDVNELAGLRMEDPEVFEVAHALVLRLIHEGKVTGMRLDHIDGLFDPSAYLQVLREKFRPQRPYVVVEKILSEEERLSSDWAIQGTTGYDFLNSLNSVYVEPLGCSRFCQALLPFHGSQARLPRRGVRGQETDHHDLDGE